MAKPNSSGPEEALLSYPVRPMPAGLAIKPHTGSENSFSRAFQREKEPAFLFHDNWMKTCGWEHNSFQNLMNYLPIKETRGRGEPHNFDKSVPFITLFIHMKLLLLLTKRLIT